MGTCVGRGGLKRIKIQLNLGACFRKPKENRIWGVGMVTY
jgi:hypothetical protein